MPFRLIAIFNRWSMLCTISHLTYAIAIILKMTPCNFDSYKLIYCFRLPWQPIRIFYIDFAMNVGNGNVWICETMKIRSMDNESIQFMQMSWVFCECLRLFIFFVRMSQVRQDHLLLVSDTNFHFPPWKAWGWIFRKAFKVKLWDMRALGYAAPHIRSFYRCLQLKSTETCCTKAHRTLVTWVCVTCYTRMWHVT